MIPITLMVLAASLLGSAHCVGMCGPFVAIAVGPSHDVSHLRLQLSYHGGRLLTYVLLGVASGSLGALVNLTGTLAGLSSVAAVLAGGTMLLIGAVELARLGGVRLARLHPPAWLTRGVRFGQRYAMALPPLKRAGLIGCCTTLLPCGWLYAFAITAAGTGNPVYGGWVMAVFWVGTLPLLMAVGASTRLALGRLGSVVPAACALGLMVVGTMTLFHRASLSAETIAQLVASQQSSAATPVPDASVLPSCCQDSAQHQEHP